MPTTPTEDKGPDWERIEREYRAGLLSVREIARACGVSHTAIQKRADKDAWARDLRAKINARADELVAKAQVAKTVAGRRVATDIVESNATSVAQVRLAHRKDIHATRELAMSMMRELIAQTGHPEELDRLADIVFPPASEEEEGSGKRAAKMLELFQAVTSLPERAKTLKALAETLQRLIGLEREAFGIGPVKGDEGADEPPPAASGSARDHYTWLCQQRPGQKSPQ
jgi:hypothetical protein